jgi:GNAT superfamily N-acetyltransferase
MIEALTIDRLGDVEDAAREFYAAAPGLGRFRLDRFRALWTQILANDTGVIFADECADGQIHGVIGGVVHPEIYGDRTIAEEFFWFVRPYSRGSGVALYRAFERWARERGADEIQMCHLTESMPAKVARFYSGAGFHAVEVRYAKAL